MCLGGVLVIGVFLVSLLLAIIAENELTDIVGVIWVHLLNNGTIDGLIRRSVSPSVLLFGILLRVLGLSCISFEVRV